MRRQNNTLRFCVDCHIYCPGFEQEVLSDALFGENDGIAGLEEEAFYESANDGDPGKSSHEEASLKGSLDDL